LRSVGDVPSFVASFQLKGILVPVLLLHVAAAPGDVVHSQLSLVASAKHNENNIPCKQNSARRES
jgi:hypothetical protein